jgi:hypothetical protein
MRPFFAKETITRLRYPTRQDGGVTVPDLDAAPDELAITRCWLEPIQSDEQSDGRLAVSTGYLVDAPAGADITEADQVRYRDIVYDVDGDPLRVPSPTGVLDSVRLTIQRWEG